ncbi:hypothetical protein LTR66_016966 [Elasticomyces elasticus]|nr:hypothetical protein LTR66_016966 [Elasticomyces elasticus]
MAVGQAVSAWETEDPTVSLSHARGNMAQPVVSRKLSKSIRLSLQTMFQPTDKRQTRNFSRPTPRSTPNMQAMLEAEFYNRKIQSQTAMLSPTSSFGSASPASSCGSRTIKRYPSTIDMALEAQRCDIGLGLLEPRPCTPATPGTPTPGVREGSPVIMDGIFEVIGGQ